MNSFFLAIFGLLNLAVASFALGIVEIPEIQVLQGEKIFTDNSLTTVYGTRNCGGPGHLVQWRLAGCNTSNSTCQYPADGMLHRSSLEFVPSQDIEQIGARIVFLRKDKDPLNIVELPIRNSSVVKDVHVAVVTSGSVDEKLKGMSVTAQYTIFRVDSKETEVCAEADFDFV